MVTREDLIHAAENDDPEKLIQIADLHKNTSDPFDLGELLATFDRAHQDGLWDHLQMKCTASLLGLELEADKEDDINEELSHTIKILDSIVTIAVETITIEEVYVSEHLLPTVIILHGMLLSIPDPKFQDHLSSLLEKWWMLELAGKEEISAQTILYLLEKSLADKAGLNCVKRVWQMRGCLEHINLDNQTSETLRTLLLNCFISSLYIKKEQGRKFLSFLFGLNNNFIEVIHSTIKAQIPIVAKSSLPHYGEVYFRAWKNATGESLKILEDRCIQDLIYNGVHVQRGGQMSMATRIKQVLHYFHAHKLQSGVDEMLLRLYDPILWRSLRVANPHVRANALELLIDAFPFANPLYNAQEADALMQKQFDILDTLLVDPVPLLRFTAIQGISRICNAYWEVLPAATIKNFITKLAQDLAWDGSSADVRATVVRGFSHLLENRLAHPLLKTLLPELRNLLHDVSEKVRVAFLELLLKIKKLKTIQFWTVAPPDHLLARLEVDPPSVAKRIVTLLVASYFPVDKDSNELLTRTVTLIKTNPGAARKFYQYAAQQHVSPVNTAKLMTLICRCILQCVKNEAMNNASAVEADVLESFEEDDQAGEEHTTQKSSGRRQNKAVASQSPDSQEEEEDSGNEEEEETDDDDMVSMKDLELMANLLETIVILWMTIGNSIKEKRFEPLLDGLRQRFGVALPHFMRAFDDKRSMSAIIMLAGFLPSNIIPTLSRGMVSKLKAMSTDNTQQDYSAMLECMCNWGKVSDLLELIGEWLDAGLAGHCEEDKANKSTSKKRSVGFKEPVEPQPLLALDFLSYLCRDFVCREALLSKRAAAIGTCKTLKKCIKCLELRFKSSEELSENATDEFLFRAFEAYLKLEVILHKKENKTNAIQVLDELVTWTDCEVLILFKKQSSGGAKKKGRRLMGHADATLLSDPSSSETLAAQTLSGTACMTLSETLLSDTVLGKRTMGDSNSENICSLGEKVLQGLLVIASEMLLVGVADHELASHLADLATNTLQLEESTKFLPLIAKLMYQITELTLNFEQEADEGVEGQGDIIPGMLNKVIHMLAVLVKNKKEQAKRILPSIKLAFGEVLSAYYRHLSLNQSINKDLIATVMNACVAEVSAAINKDPDFEACTCVSELPTLSSFLLGLLQRRKDMMGLFLGEMCQCVRLGTFDTPHALYATTHILNAMSKGRVSASDIKDCLNVIQVQFEHLKLPDDLSEESPTRSIHRNNQELLKECMNNFGMVV